MGEPARSLMVAAVALTYVVSANLARAQSDFGVPNSLSGKSAFEQAAQAFHNRTQQAASGTNPSSSSLPGFTSGLQDQRASHLQGGPNTDPYKPPSPRGVPSTDPYAAATGGSASAGNPGGYSFGSAAGPAGGQPNRSPQALEIDRAKQNLPPAPGSAGAGSAVTAAGLPGAASPTSAANGPNTAGATASAATSNGFATLPEGVRLPPRNTPGLTGNSAAGSASQPNWDPSVFNATTNKSAANSASGFGTPPGFSSASASPNSGGMGMPGATRSRTSMEQAEWTAEQVAALAAQFGIKRNDARLSDPAFVNDLYQRYQTDQANSAFGQTAPPADAGTTGLVGAAGLVGAGSGSSGTDHWPSSSSLGLPPALPGSTAGHTPASSGSALGHIASSQNQASQNIGLPPTSPDLGRTQPASTDLPRTTRRDVDHRLSQKDIDGLPPGAFTYDKYGNPINKYGNILDRFGEPVDDETAYELTHGRKHRAEQQRIAKEAVEKQSVTPPSGIAAAAIGIPNGTPIASASDLRPGFSDPNTTRPGSAADRKGALDRNGDVPPADHAGIGGSPTAIGKSNPYVNVFLLCSLVANAFLFVWLQRLWHHHRDLIASSRTAASGISISE